MRLNAKLALVLLLFWSLFSVSVDLREQMRLYLLRNRPDPVFTMTARIERIRGELPATGVIGYIGPSDDPTEMRYERYYLTQFALAPLIIVDSPDHDLVFGNFIDAALDSPSDFVVVKDLGGGLWLLRKRAK